MKKVTAIPSVINVEKKKTLHVAAYCRVSTDSDAQLDSLNAQRVHYERYIHFKKDWELVDIYYDEGLTGTKKDNRPGLLRLMEDCRAHRVDYIITKSLSRFSRSTTDCLELIRELVSLQIPVFFEKENLDTSSMESELLLTILSSMAAGESSSISENSKWAIRKRFQNGTFKIAYPPYGYDCQDGEMVINPTQATVVQAIFADYLSGMGATQIAKKLNQQGLCGKKGAAWTGVTVTGVLTNEKYTGDALFQKTYTDQQFNRHTNTGQLDQYLCPEHHPAIISHKAFDRVALLLQQHRQQKGNEKGSTKCQNRYAFSGKLRCGCCGGVFKRRIHTAQTQKYVAWTCSTHIADKVQCPMLFLYNDDLERTYMTMMNKLIFSRKKILAPLARSMKNAEMDDKPQQIRDLETELLQLFEQRKTLQQLMGAGYLDYSVFTAQHNQLMDRTEDLHREIESIKRDSGPASQRLECIRHLLRFAEQSPMQTAFDEALVAEHLDHAVVLDRQTIQFHLKCGLTLTERL